MKVDSCERPSLKRWPVSSEASTWPSMRRHELDPGKFRFPTPVFRETFSRLAAYRDQVQRVGGLDPASQLLAPPRTWTIFILSEIYAAPPAAST